jgi:iron complex transport system ATP-binding protein
MSVLTLNNVSVFKPGAGDHLLVDSACFEINAGEILTIIGPNGAGKSSLLKAITGEWGYSGEITSPNLSTEHKLRARQMSVLPQFSLLNFPYRVSEVVMLGRIPHQTGNKVDQSIMQQALELMDVSFLQNRFYTELSGGEKQRVQLARVMAQIWSAEDADSIAYFRRANNSARPRASTCLNARDKDSCQARGRGSCGFARH